MMIVSRNLSIGFALALTAMVGAFCGCSAAMHHGESVADASPGDSRNKAIQLDEKQKAEIQMGLARSLEAQGDLENAETIYREILAGQPRHAAAIHSLAIVCDRQSRYEESKVLFLKAIELSSNDPVIWGDYGYSLYRQRKWSEAEKTLRQALKLHPRDKRAHNHLGLVLAQTGQPDAAIAEFLLAGCSEAEAHSNLRTILKLNGSLSPSEEPSPLVLESTPRPTLKVSSQQPTSLATSSGHVLPTSPQDQGSATVRIEGSHAN